MAAKRKTAKRKTAKKKIAKKKIAKKKDLIGTPMHFGKAAKR
ncbi:MAG TPA: hypothetical protein VJ648_08835 [Vicinamibacteria bacterium]|nr:hypothetical protein [Vicinamibacteria bacterium]